MYCPLLNLLAAAILSECMELGTCSKRKATKSLRLNSSYYLVCDAGLRFHDQSAMPVGRTLLGCWDFSWESCFIYAQRK